MRHGGSRGPGLLSLRRSTPAATLARTTGRGVAVVALPGAVAAVADAPWVAVVAGAAAESGPAGERPPPEHAGRPSATSTTAATRRARRAAPGDPNIGPAWFHGRGWSGQLRRMAHEGQLGDGGEIALRRGGGPGDLDGDPAGADVHGE